MSEDRTRISDVAGAQRALNGRVRFGAILLAWCLVGISETAAQTPAAHDQVATFSVVACDTAAGFWGIGVESKHVSAGAIVPAARAGVGAVATQAAANVRFKPVGLALLERGLSAVQVRDSLVEMDGESYRRQFAIADANCNVAAFTGDSTVDWKGHDAGPNYSVQGNMLAGPEVIEAMAAAYEGATEARVPFPERLIRVLEAGQSRGGDKRGRQAAGLLVVRAGGGFLGGDDRYIDIRVDDHPAPIRELGRVYDVYMREEHPADYFLPDGSHEIEAPSGPHICRLATLLSQAGFGSAPPAGEEDCVLEDEVIRNLKQFQEQKGLPVTPRVTQEAADRLFEAASDTL